MSSGQQHYTKHHKKVKGYLERLEKGVDEIIELQKKKETEDAELFKKARRKHHTKKVMFNRLRYLKATAHHKERELLENTSLGDLIK